MAIQAYLSRRRHEARPDTPASAVEAQEPSLQALQAGAAPTQEQLGSKIDLPGAIREKMENIFGADLSSVQLYESQAVADAGAQAMAMGNNIAFAPGEVDFTSTAGQSLLGHELSHVVSQARGEVSGTGFLNDSALEARADREGAMAAAGESVYAGPVTPLSASSAAGAAGPMQAKKPWTWLKEKFGKKPAPNPDPDPTPVPTPNPTPTPSPNPSPAPTPNPDPTPPPSPNLEPAPEAVQAPPEPAPAPRAAIPTTQMRIMQKNYEDAGHRLNGIQMTKNLQEQDIGKAGARLKLSGEELEGLNQQPLYKRLVMSGIRRAAGGYAPLLNAFTRGNHGDKSNYLKELIGWAKDSVHDDDSRLDWDEVDQQDDSDMIDRYGAWAESHQKIDALHDALNASSPEGGAPLFSDEDLGFKPGERDELQAQNRDFLATMGGAVSSFRALRESNGGSSEELKRLREERFQRRVARAFRGGRISEEQREELLSGKADDLYLLELIEEHEDE